MSTRAAHSAEAVKTRGAVRARKIAGKLVLALVSVVVTLLLAEGAIRLFVPVRSVGPVGTEYDPVYGKRLKRSYSCTRSSPEFSYVLSTNSLGFRGPEPSSPPKGAVVFLGDSFTMGSTVNDGEEYPALIRKKLAEAYGPGVVPVLNAGIANTGNGWWVKFLRLEAEEYDPRFIVMQFTVNDFADNVHEKLFKLDESGALIERPVPRQKLAGELEALFERIPLLQYSYLLAVGRQAVAHGIYRSRVRSMHTDPVTQDPLTYRLFEECLRLCAQHGWPVGVLVVKFEPEQLAKMREIAEPYGVPLIVIPTKDKRPDLYWKINGHWNVAGHKWVAERVYQSFFADGVPGAPESSPGMAGRPAPP